MCDGARVYMGARGARQGVDDPNGLEVHGIALNENTVRHAERCKKKKHLRHPQRRNDDETCRRARMTMATATDLQTATATVVHR